MAIYFVTSTPNKLLTSFKKAIDDGHVKTWSYDAEGDFTHTPDQWRKKAWLRPTIVEGTRLTFNIVAPKGIAVTWAIYAVYQGRFIESLIEHCHDIFTEAQATPKPVRADLVG